MTAPAATGIMLCGTSVKDGSTVQGRLLSIQGFGGSRKAVDITSGDQAGGWGLRLLSCIRMMKPFRVVVLASGNDDWTTLLGEAEATWEIDWPTEKGYTNGGKISFPAGVTDVGIDGELEGRVTKTLEITPTGAPTFTIGTAAS